MNVNAVGGTHRPTHITPHVGGVEATRPVRRSDEGSGGAVDDQAVETASDRRSERMQRRAEKFETRLDHVIQHKLEKVDAKIERFVQHHGLSDSAVEAIAGYREQFEATLTGLRTGLVESGYEPGAIAAFRDAVKTAMGELREQVRGVLDGDPVVEDVSDEVAAAEVTDDSAEPAEDAAAAGAAVEPADDVESGEPVETEAAPVEAAPVEGTPVDEATPETVTVSAELVTGLQVIRDAIDAFLESVAVDDAFDPSEVLLPPPAVDVQA